MNLFFLRNDIPEKGTTQPTETTLCIIKCFSFGKYHAIMESMVAPSQLKAIITTYDTQLKASLEVLTKQYKDFKGLQVRFVNYDFSRMFSPEIKAYLDGELKLLATTNALNKMVIDSGMKDD
jgi:hypothetical protein